MVKFLDNIGFDLELLGLIETRTGISVNIQEHPGCQIYGQTMTTDHHDELIQVGIVPSLRGTESTHKCPYVIFCAPPSRTADYPEDVRYELD